MRRERKMRTKRGTKTKRNMKKETKEGSYVLARRGEEEYK